VYQNKDHTNQKHIVTKSSVINVSSQNSLLEISKTISNLIEDGDNLFLYGEIGVGKTTFVRFLVNYLQSKYNIKTTEVLSPTFNILNEYKINNLNLKHYDLYRIRKKEEIDDLGIFDEKYGVNIIEWPKIVESYNVKYIKFNFSYFDNFKRRNLIISSNYKNKIIDEFK
tara:strand:- start:12547 stop:13053 length:507 start_codon:yes stop_codon:yes gene_type:complete